MTGNPSATTSAIALLGRRDVPTDGVEDYCKNLANALRNHDLELELMRLRWDEVGWIQALQSLWVASRTWKRKRILVQYTALMWSRRGFPLTFLIVLLLLKVRAVHLIVIFHDVRPYPGRRLVDRIRRLCQLFVLRRANRWAAASVLTVPPEEVSWLPHKSINNYFIPVGASVPAMAVPDRPAREGHEAKIIAVFGITDGGDISREISDITLAAKKAAESVSGVQLLTLGRGSMESQDRFRQALQGTGMEFSALGILPGDKVSQILANADVTLFVRGCVSTQRTTAIASIANAVPLVAYANPKLTAPLAEAGVVGVPCGDRQALAEAVVRVLTDRQLRLVLIKMSQHAYEKYFSWEAVAARFGELLNHA